MTTRNAMTRRDGEPFRDLLSLRDTISGAFDDLFSGRPVAAARLALPQGEVSWFPAVDVKETEEELVVVAALPGVDKKDIQVEVKEDHLVLSGTRRGSEEDGWLRQELPTGPFCRAFALNSPVDAGKVKASHRDGLLEVRLPKEARARARRVEVE